MKAAVFNALPTYTTLAQIALLADGTYFFFGAQGVAGNNLRLTPNTHASQANNTALRHRISYCVRDSNAPGGYRMIYDILEANIGPTLVKTIKKRNKVGAVVTGDFDTSRDIISETPYV